MGDLGILHFFVQWSQGAIECLPWKSPDALLFLFTGARWFFVFLAPAVLIFLICWFLVFWFRWFLRSGLILLRFIFFAWLCSFALASRALSFWLLGFQAFRACRFVGFMRSCFLCHPGLHPHPPGTAVASFMSHSTLRQNSNQAHTRNHIAGPDDSMDNCLGSAKRRHSPLPLSSY